MMGTAGTTTTSITTFSASDLKSSICSISRSSVVVKCRFYFGYITVDLQKPICCSFKPIKQLSLQATAVKKLAQSLPQITNNAAKAAQCTPLLPGPTVEIRVPRVQGQSPMTLGTQRVF